MDIEREAVRPLAIGRSRDWLLALARHRAIACPVAVEIDAAEAMALARAGIPVDETTVAELAREAQCSRPYMTGVLRDMAREGWSKCNS